MSAYCLCGSIGLQDVTNARASSCVFGWRHVARVYSARFVWTEGWSKQPLFVENTQNAIKQSFVSSKYVWYCLARAHALSGDVKTVHVIQHPIEIIVPCCATAKHVFLDSGLMAFGIISHILTKFINTFYAWKARIIFIALLVTAAQPGYITKRVTSHDVKMASVDNSPYFLHSHELRWGDELTLNCLENFLDPYHHKSTSFTQWSLNIALMLSCRVILSHPLHCFLEIFYKFWYQV